MQDDMLELLEKCERWGIEIEPGLGAVRNVVGFPQRDLQRLEGI
jgi:hypothetical protein